MASALLRSIIMGGRTGAVRTLRTLVSYERRIGVGSREGRYRPLLLEALAPVSRGLDLAAGDLLGPLRPLRQRRRFQAGPVLIRGPGRMGDPCQEVAQPRRAQVAHPRPASTTSWSPHRTWRRSWRGALESRTGSRWGPRSQNTPQWMHRRLWSRRGSPDDAHAQHRDGP